MLGHENVADDAEAEFDAQVGEGGDKLTLEAVRIEHAGAPIGAGGDEVKVIEVVETPEPGHQEIVAQGWEVSRGRRHQKTMSAPPPWLSPNCAVLPSPILTNLLSWPNIPEICGK